MGVDEAGRGPVLGPMVYGVAFCPVEYKEQLDGMGFNGEDIPFLFHCIHRFLMSFFLIVFTLDSSEKTRSSWTPKHVPAFSNPSPPTQTILDGRYGY